MVSRKNFSHIGTVSEFFYDKNAYFKAGNNKKTKTQTLTAMQ